jgi:endonuclease YncB( thermonuclease family)
MRSFALPFGVTVLISTTSANAGDTPTPTQSTTASQPAASTIADGDKMECRMMAAKTGSRLGGRRECRTKREWEDIRVQNEHELEKMQARDALVRQ